MAIWIWLTRIFAAAIPSLTTRSVGPLSSLNDPDKGVSPQESTALIVMNYHSITEDLGTLIKLMHIARNLLVNADPEVPQDICAAVHFDQMVYQTIILCVNVTSKGYDGEILDEAQRLKLQDITESCKRPPIIVLSRPLLIEYQTRSCWSRRCSRRITGQPNMIATRCPFGLMFSSMKTTLSTNSCRMPRSAFSDQR